MNKTEQHKKAMIEALEKSLGVVTTACKSVGIGRTMHYEWLKIDPEYKQTVEDIQNITLDFAESQLHKQIKDGNTTATIFYLKTKERTEDTLRAKTSTSHKETISQVGLNEAKFNILSCKGEQEQNTSSSRWNKIWRDLFHPQGAC